MSQLLGLKMNIPDAAEKIDFVASAESIKEVFKLTISDAKFCIAIHKVGDTLVLDSEFDATASTTKKKKKNALAIKKRTLYSKFLFYSVDGAAPRGKALPSSSGSGRRRKRNRGEVAEMCSRQEPIAMDDSESPYRQAVHWKVGKMNLLLGSDLVIFRRGPQGGSSSNSNSSSTASLRLHDVRDECTSMVCLDYWLDNRINGVSETAICCHVDGLVQGYQVISTPDLKKRAFEPEAVCRNGVRILEFIQSQCREDGATYCLVKKPTGELQLYKINSTRDARGDNSALAPAISGLYFRLAERIYDTLVYGYESDDEKKKRDSVRRARELYASTCDALIVDESSPEEHRKMVATSHERLADLDTFAVEPLEPGAAARRVRRLG